MAAPSLSIDAIAPGADAIVRMALELTRKDSRVLVLGAGSSALSPLFARQTDTANVYDGTAGDRLESVESFDLILCFNPSRLGPLIQVISDLQEPLAADGRLIVTDLVWQTAPTPQLARAFAPAPGLEKVRPIEGYEMQLDHAEYEIVERQTFGRDAWLRHLAHHTAAGAQAAAIEADDRGAAVYAAWTLKKA